MNLMQEDLLASSVIHADETEIQVPGYSRKALLELNQVQLSIALWKLPKEISSIPTSIWSLFSKNSLDAKHSMSSIESCPIKHRSTSH